MSIFKKKKDKMTEAEKAVADLRAERDALAARVLELENTPCPVPQRRDRESTEARAELEAQLQEMKNFLRTCLRSGQFNSTHASELLK